MNVRSENMKQHSTWFKVNTTEAINKNSLTISSPFVTSLWPRTTEGEPLPSVKVDNKKSLKIPKSENELKKVTKALGATVKTRKIKLNPTTDQTNVLRKMFGIARWTYNQTVAFARDKKNIEKRKETLDPKTGNPISWRKFIRSYILNEDSALVKENPWSRELGYDIRDDVCKDFLTAMKGCWTKMEQCQIEIDEFKMKFRSKKRDKSSSIYFRSRWIENKGRSIVLKWPKQSKMEFKLSPGNRIPFSILMDCRIQRTWLDEYYLCVPVTYKPRVEGGDSQTPQNLRICSLDPGVRAFQTVLDVNNSRAYRVADGANKKLYLYCIALDRLIGRMAKATKSNADAILGEQLNE